jgi:hypothetical protein
MEKDTLHNRELGCLINIRQDRLSVKNAKTDNDGQYIFIKGLIHQEKLKIIKPIHQKTELQNK